MGFSFFTAAAKVPSIRALLARLMRRQRVRAQAKIKRKFTQALLLAGDGRRAPYLVRRLSAGEHRLLVVAAVELLRVMRGAPAARIVRLLRRYHVRETLGVWMQHRNAQFRAIAAEGLGHMGDSQGCLVLGRALNDPDHTVRIAAAESLIKLGVPPPADNLVAALEVEGAPSVRLWRMLDVMRAHHPDPAKRTAPCDPVHDIDDAAMVAASA